MFRRRPMPKVHVKPEQSLRYELIQPGVIRYPDGREVCLDTAEGWREYRKRIEFMWRRQDRRCCLCGKRLALQDATFEHQRRRGMAAAFRDDRTASNGAAHWICNRERG